MDYEKEYADCLNKILGTCSKQNAKPNSVESPFNTFQDIYIPERRIESIQKGLGYIYEVSKDEGVFHTFGNDIIQCFYDISRVGFILQNY